MTTTLATIITTKPKEEEDEKKKKKLLNLPNELLLYLFRNFLDLPDLWCLFQTSQELRFFASTVIGTTWKIEVRAAAATSTVKNNSSSSGGGGGGGGGGTEDHMMIKLQCRGALIALQQLSNQLSFHQQDQLPIIRKSFLIEPDLVANTSTAIVHFLTVGSNIITNNGGVDAVDTTSSSSSSSSSGMVVGEGLAVATTSTEEEQIIVVVNLEEEEDEEEEKEEEEEEEEEEQQQQDDAIIQNKSTTTTTTTTTLIPHTIANKQHNKKLKVFQELIKQESRLHTKIIQGIASYKHKFVLIEDIDIRNRIRTAVDVVFHHAVFVSAISSSSSSCIQNRALAAVLVRLLTKLDVAFPSYCREITYTLADNIKAFLEYTGYKILAAFSPSIVTTNSDSYNNNKAQLLKLTLASISCCFDLMGAAFVGKILSDSHVDCAVQRTCELLSASSSNNNNNNSDNNNNNNNNNNNMLIIFKRRLLTNLLDHWLTIKREIGSGELCRYIRLEIEKCGVSAGAGGGGGGGGAPSSS